MEVRRIKINQIYALAENGGRTLASVGRLELRDGVKRGVRSCFILDHGSHGKQYLIPAAICDQIYNLFALGGDRKKVFALMEETIKKSAN